MGRFDHIEMGDYHSQNPEANPSSSDIIDENYYLRKADEAFAVEDYERALAFYSRALQYQINTEDAWLGQLRCLVDLNEIHEAITWSDKAMERFPKSAQILAARAVAELRQGRAEAAIKYSDASLSSGGVTAYVWIARAEALMAVSALNSKACFSKAIEMAPNDWLVWAWIGHAYLVHGKYAQALENYRAAVRLDGSRHTCWYWIGRCCEELGDARDAEVAYRTALQLQPAFFKASEAMTHVRQTGLISGIADALKRLFKGR